MQKGLHADAIRKRLAVFETKTLPKKDNKVSGENDDFSCFYFILG